MGLIKNLAIIFSVFTALLYISCDEEALEMGYSCVSNECFSEERGQYLTLADCQSVCGNVADTTNKVRSWNCVDYGCVEVADDTGTYASYPDCEKICSSTETTVFQSCLDGQGLWALYPACPPYVLGPPLDIYVDIEDRFEGWMEIECVQEENKLRVMFYDQNIYAEVDVNGVLNIPSQTFEADFTEDFGEMNSVIGDDFFIDIQVSGNGSIDATSGQLNLDFDFTVPGSEWLDMTSCVLLLDRNIPDDVKDED